MTVVINVMIMKVSC